METQEKMHTITDLYLASYLATLDYEIEPRQMENSHRFYFLVNEENPEKIAAIKNLFYSDEAQAPPRKLFLAMRNLKAKMYNQDPCQKDNIKNQRDEMRKNHSAE